MNCSILNTRYVISEVMSINLYKFQDFQGWFSSISPRKKQYFLNNDRFSRLEKIALPSHLKYDID
jgi:hypothetical protein